MIRYWFTFEDNDNIYTQNGCGVTARDKQDAINILQRQIFKDESVPPIKDILENVSLSQIEENHILPNIGNPIVRGIWFPQGFHFLEGES